MRVMLFQRCHIPVGFIKGDPMRKMWCMFPYGLQAGLQQARMSSVHKVARQTNFERRKALTNDDGVFYHAIQSGIRILNPITRKIIFDRSQRFILSYICLSSSSNKTFQTRYKILRHLGHFIDVFQIYMSEIYCYMLIIFIYKNTHAIRIRELKILGYTYYNIIE